MSREIWKDVPGYDGDYQASNHGNVKSFKYKEPKLLSLPQGPNGYRRICLSHKNATKCLLVHRIILLTFIGAPANSRFQGSHLDGSRTNNRLENLTWESSKDNVSRKREHGTAGIGEKNPKAKLTDKKIIAIRFLLSIGLKEMALAEMFRISNASIYYIKSNKTWKHVRKINRA